MQAEESSGAEDAAEQPQVSGNPLPAAEGQVAEGAVSEGGTAATADRDPSEGGLLAWIASLLEDPQEGARAEPISAETELVNAVPANSAENVNVEPASSASSANAAPAVGAETAAAWRELALAWRELALARQAAGLQQTPQSETEQEVAALQWRPAE